MRTIHFIIVIAVILTLQSCNGGKPKTSNIPYVDYSSENICDGETISVPFIEQNGVKYVSAKINGVSIDMIFDTGCSQTLISLLEAQMLVKRGLLTEDDYQGTTRSAIANGTIVEDMVFNLKTIELVAGDRTIVCNNVLAQVSSNVQAPVLLGNGILDRAASYTIDNENKVIKFKLK